MQVKPRAATGRSVDGMSFLETVAVLSGIILTLAVVGAVVLTQWRGLEGGPVPLYDMLRRQDPRAATMAVASGSRDFALAVRRCVACDAGTRCREWLDSGSRTGFEAFCRNAGYVSRQRDLAK